MRPSGDGRHDDFSDARPRICRIGVASFREGTGAGEGRSVEAPGPALGDVKNRIQKRRLPMYVGNGVRPRRLMQAYLRCSTR